MTGVIVIGAGQAASTFAAKFRSLDKETPLTIIGDEAEIPYQRPPLSKKYATGEVKVDQLHLRPKFWYEDQNIDIQTGVSVVGVDRQKKNVILCDGKSIAWKKLVFATGSRVRRLPDTLTKGLAGIHYIRTLNDADNFAKEIGEGKQVVIVGGGYIGLEAAAVCAQRDMDVTLVEASDRILQRVACEETSNWFRERHQSAGVSILEGVGLKEFDGQNGRVTHAILSDGSRLKADVVIVGIGILPSSLVAEECGLAVSDGIVVNQHCQTSDPNVYAAGDCAVAEYKGLPTRLESVPNAIDQANVAAENVALGTDTVYQPRPWFWSDQYDVKLQIAGLNRGYDKVVVRPGDKPGSVSHFYFLDDQLIAIDAINAPRIYMVGKRVIEAGNSISPAQAADVDLDLKSLL